MNKMFPVNVTPNTNTLQDMGDDLDWIIG